MIDVITDHYTTFAVAIVWNKTKFTSGRSFSECCRNSWMTHEYLQDLQERIVNERQIEGKREVWRYLLEIEYLSRGKCLMKKSRFDLRMKYNYTSIEQQQADTPK